VFGAQSEVNLMVEDKTIVIELTNRCNMKCVKCPRQRYLEKWGKAGQGFMRFGTFNKILSETDKQRNHYVIGWRGEPTWNKDFPEMIRKLVQYKHQSSRITVVTNGVFIPTGNLKGQVLVNVKEVYEALTLVDRIVFSLHNRLSLKGYKLYLENYYSEDLGQEVWPTTVEGMDPNFSVIPPRGGYRNVLTEWSTVKNPGKRAKCRRIGKEIAIGWDGRVSRCYFHWDTDPMYMIGLYTVDELFEKYVKPLASKYPDEICSACPLKKTRAPYESG